MEILLLADCPEHVTTVAAWLYNEWGQRPGNTVEITESRLRERTNRDCIPLTVVAVDDGVAVGTAALRTDDMPSRPELTPWLASVYVDPKFRNRRIGSQLVAAIESIAAKLGVEQLYLFTPDRESFYARLGWHILEHTVHHDKPVVVMQKAMAAGHDGTRP